MANIKKRLTHDQEFQIMKIVLDKFLWMGFLAILYGVYLAVIQELVWNGIAWGVAGVVIWVIFIVMLIREYEVIK